MRSPFTHLLRRSLILLAILFASDRLIGTGLEHMFYRQHHGDDAVTRYTLDSADQTLLVFGSSRASHTYNTALLKRKLGISVYNCGRDEMGITYAAGVLPVVYKRYSPKYLIVEVLPVELGTRGKTESERHIATVLLPFAHRFPSLWSTIAYAGNDEVYKAAVSKIYPYNSMLGAFVQNTYTHLGHTTEQGYEPLLKEIDSATYTKSYWRGFNESTDVNAALSARFAGIIDLAAAHGSRVFVTISPFYFYQDISHNPSFLALKEITAAHGATFLNFSFDKRFVRHPHLFNDDLHLNDHGAQVFTQIMADTLLSLGVGDLSR